MRFARRSKYYYLKFMRLKGDPKSLAGGAAIGVLVGMSPTMPLHTLIILTLTILTRTSTITAIITSWLVCNPLTCIPIYYFSMMLGNFLTPYELNWPRIERLLDALISSPLGFSHSLQEVAGLGYEAVIVLVSGGLVLALPFTIVSYYLSLRLFINFRREKIKNVEYPEH